MHSFEGFPSVVIATSVHKRRLHPLTAKVKPNFVSADTAHALRTDSAAGSLQLMGFFTEPSCIAAGDGRSQRAKVAGRVALKLFAERAFNSIVCKIVLFFQRIRFRF